MSHLELLADELNGFLYVAVVNSGHLVDLYVNTPDITGNWGSIYLGKVEKIDPKLDAAFMDLGNGLKGYLAAKHAMVKRPEEEVRRSGITKMLQTGDMVLVQVKSEGKPRSTHENSKLLRLTTNIHTIGDALVYSPFTNGKLFSSALSENDTARLKGDLNLDGGWKIFPGIENLSDEEIQHEANYLKQVWQEILDSKEKMGSQPGLIKIGPIVLYRALMDYGLTNFEHIYIGNKKIFALMESWCKNFLPSFMNSKRLRLFKPIRPEERLFDMYDIYSAIDKAHYKTVEMECGGNIIIEDTSAMTIIDVNQGSAPSYMEANYSAAGEIARQIKLRNLNGIIIVDFINVVKKGDREKVINIIETALERDIGNTQVHGFTRLSMLEITRKRRTGSITEKIGSRA